MIIMRILTDSSPDSFVAGSCIKMLMVDLSFISTHKQMCPHILVKTPSIKNRYIMQIRNDNSINILQVFERLLENIECAN